MQFYFQICETLWNMLLQRGPCETGEAALRVGCHTKPRILGHGKICADADSAPQVRILTLLL